MSSVLKERERKQMYVNILEKLYMQPRMMVERNKIYMRHVYMVTSQQLQKERKDVYIRLLCKSTFDEIANFLDVRQNYLKTNRKPVGVLKYTEYNILKPLTCFSIYFTALAYPHKSEKMIYNMKIKSHNQIKSKK